MRSLPPKGKTQWREPYFIAVGKGEEKPDNLPTVGATQTYMLHKHISTSNPLC